MGLVRCLAEREADLQLAPGFLGMKVAQVGGSVGGWACVWGGGSLGMKVVQVCVWGGGATWA